MRFPKSLIFILAMGIAACSQDDDTPDNTGQTPPNTAASITTNEIQVPSAEIALTGGNITYSGTSEIIQRGVCWGIMPEPSLFDDYTNDGVGAGNFQSTIVNLEPNLEYFVRAYAINESDTAYGNELNFVAGENIDPDLFMVVEPFNASAELVDFSIGESIYFMAEYSIPVDWQVKIEGMESGSIKLVEGFDQIIGEQNATWSGGTTQIPIFKAEECRVTISISDRPEYGDTLMVNVLAPKVYDGALITGFETPLGQHVTLVDVEFELSDLTGRRNDIPAGEGDWFYFLEGSDNLMTNFFVGLININSSITGETYLSLPTSNPSQLYFNFMLWHDNSPHGIAVIQFISDTNDSGEFEEGEDQTFQFEGDFPLNWDGWVPFSHSMADVNINQEQLQKIIGIRVILISNEGTQPNPPLPVRFGIDHMIFTEGGPLEL